MKKQLAKIGAISALTVGLILPTTVPSNAATPPSNQNNKPNLPHQGATPTFSNASVHDPSIIQANDGSYYVFGSHLAAAKSTDLMNWTQFDNGYDTPNNKIFGDLSQNLAGSFAWAGNHDGDNPNGYSVWALDPFWNKDYVNTDGSKGAYLMYYCTSSTYKRSAIGYAVSKTIEGPFTYVNTIVYSGFTKMSNYDNGANGLSTTSTNYSKINTQYTNTNIQQLMGNGTLSGPSDYWFNSNGSYNTSNVPNAIDPTVFPDKDGNLWMTYGSWSGGLYILPIDKTTGKAIYPGKDGTTADGNYIDRYFGTKISGGYGKSGEGPFINYDKDTDYYYLYESLGGLAANGGYNMRVFRSKNPDGPYLDPAGKNAVFPSSSVNNSDYGEKLMGNFLFDRKPGDPGTGLGEGYVSPGGNSVLYDQTTGKKFVVMHSRFPGQGEYHAVRVQQIFMNEDGWPVISPYRYSGETITKVNREDIVGDYKFINHGRATTADITKPVDIHLNQDGTVSGAVTGTWEKAGHYDAEISIGGNTYDGVFVRDWDPVSQAYVMTFTAVSSEGVTIWGSKYTDMPDAQVVDAVYNDLSIDNADQVNSNLALPAEGTHEAVITWQSSDPSLVSNTGEVNRPDGLNTVSATLTATITKGDVTKTKSFTITVLPYVPATLVAQYALNGDLADSTKAFGAGSVTGNRLDNPAGGSITFDAQGKDGQAAIFNGTSGIKLPNGLINNNSYSVSLWVKPSQLATYTTTFFGAANANSWVSLLPKGPLNGSAQVWSGDAWYDAATGVNLPVNQWTNLIFTVDNGTINVYVNGAKKFTGSNFPNIFSNKNASFGLGVNYWDTPFKGEMDDLRVYSGALTPNQLADLSK